MQKPSLSAVCLCSRHPFVLQELSALVAGSFRPLICRFDGPGPAGEGQLKIPRAAVYVVDSAGRTEEVEHVVAEIQARYPRARAVVLAESLDDTTSFAFLRSGAKGLVPYSEVRDQLVPALRTVAGGGFWVPRTSISRLIEKTFRPRPRPSASSAGATLSRREKEVLDLLLENLSNKEIASRLHISSRTAKFHVSKLLAKYDVESRVDLLMMRMA